MGIRGVYLIKARYHRSADIERIREWLLSH